MNSSTAQATSAVGIFDVSVISDLIKKYRLSLDKSSTALNLQEVIFVDFLDFSNAFIALAGSELQKHNEIVKGDEFGLYLLHFSLSEPFKDLLFLHRDVLLQLYIAHHKKVENLVDIEAINRHFLESKKVLLQALDNFAQKTLLEQKEAERLEYYQGWSCLQIKA